MRWPVCKQDGGGLATKGQLVSCAPVHIESERALRGELESVAAALDPSVRPVRLHRRKGCFIRMIIMRKMFSYWRPVTWLTRCTPLFQQPSPGVSQCR